MLHFFHWIWDTTCFLSPSVLTSFNVSCSASQLAMIQFWFIWKYLYVAIIFEEWFLLHLDLWMCKPFTLSMITGMANMCHLAVCFLLVPWVLCSLSTFLCSFLQEVFCKIAFYFDSLLVINLHSVVLPVVFMFIVFIFELA